MASVVAGLVLLWPQSLLAEQPLELSCIGPEILGLTLIANTKNNTDEHYLRGGKYFGDLRLGYISNPQVFPYFKICPQYPRVYLILPLLTENHGCNRLL